MYPATFAASSPDRAAIIMGGSGEVVTYRELDERSNRFAHYLRGLELGPTDVVAILMENNARYHEVAWGVRRIGRYLTPVNTHLTADEIAYIVNDSGATVLVASPGVADLARGPSVRRPARRPAAGAVPEGAAAAVRGAAVTGLDVLRRRRRRAAEHARP